MRQYWRYVLSARRRQPDISAEIDNAAAAFDTLEFTAVSMCAAAQPKHASRGRRQAVQSLCRHARCKIFRGRVRMAHERPLKRPTGQCSGISAMAVQDGAVKDDQRAGGAACRYRHIGSETCCAIVFRKSVDDVDEADKARPVLVMREVDVHALSRRIGVNRSCMKRAEPKRSPKHAATRFEQRLVNVQLIELPVAIDEIDDARRCAADRNVRIIGISDRVLVSVRDLLYAT